MATRQSRAIRRPNGAKPDPVRSVRVSDELWAKAKRRADYDGVTLSRVMHQFLVGYADGRINLPRTEVVYTQPAEPVPESEPVGS